MLKNPCTRDPHSEEDHYTSAKNEPYNYAIVFRPSLNIQV